MYPLIAALAQVGGILIDKITITRRQVALHVFVPIIFIFLFLFTAILFPFLGHFSENIFELKYLILFGVMLVVALIWNIFYYQGVQSEKVHEFEIILMFQPLLTILLATIVFSGERSWHLIIASLVAAVALIAAKINKDHFMLTRGSLKLIIAVIFMSVELIIIKYLLNVFSPVALYCIRTGILGVFFIFFYHPQIRKVAKQNLGLMALSALLGTTQMISKFYGFELFGVVYTSLILILSPILVYITSTIFLHERLKIRTIISGVVILGCIIYASLVGK